MKASELYSGLVTKVRGYNGALATSNEFVSPQSIAWGEGSTNKNLSLGAGATLTVASSSANDKAASAGASKIKVIGAEAVTGKVIEEEITLNGQTSVTSVALFQAVYHAYVSALGTGGSSNAGIIGIAIGTCTNTSGVLTAPTPALTIPVGEGMATGAMFIVPSGEKRVCKDLIIGASTQPVVVTIWIRSATEGLWMNYGTIPVGNVGLNRVDLSGLPELEAGDVIRVDALSTTAAGRVFVELTLERVL